MLPVWTVMVYEDRFFAEDVKAVFFLSFIVARGQVARETARHASVAARCYRYGRLLLRRVFDAKEDVKHSHCNAARSLSAQPRRRNKDACVQSWMQ
jgi:hypothetical protein